MKKRIYAVLICLFMVFFMVSSAKAAKKVTIYIDDGNADYFVEKVVEGKSKADSLIENLVKYKMVPEGTKVNSFEVVKEDGKTIGKLDLSNEYLEAVTHTGTAGETMYIYSVVNTVIRNLDVQEVNLTCEDEIISTGHEIYDYPLQFYDHVLTVSSEDSDAISVEPADTNDMKNEEMANETQKITDTDTIDEMAQQPRKEEKKQVSESKQVDRKESEVVTAKENKNEYENKEDVTDTNTESVPTLNTIEKSKKESTLWKWIILIGAFILVSGSTFLYVGKKKKA